jgi:serine/threonine protein kinase/ActR/RegA family two-component response regulator
LADPLGRILVVDDNEDNCNVLSRRLRRQGYDVEVAGDGPTALAACEREDYDAVILDVMMPGMSGIEVLERLRKTSSATELLVIMATAKTDSVDVVDALKRGANDYVTKPIDFPVLLARLETQLTMKKEADKRSGSVIDVTLGIEPGTVLDGRYEILDKQGEGGFAVVYRATQLSTGQEVALKHARPDVMRADEDGVHLERFKREVTLIGQLSHANVVRLIDSGSIPVRRATNASAEDAVPTRVDGAGAKAPDAGAKADVNDAAASRTRRRPSAGGEGRAIEVPYIVMEFLRGESLAELIAREAPLDPQRAVDLVVPVLSALGAAHAQGVVHRDVKPGNIMLAEGPEGTVEPKVLDFGIAKLSEPDVRALTISASLIGTPQYMAPEQARGWKDVDARADQFAVASVLYEMLTGRSLYRGESFLELVSKVLGAEYVPLSELRSDLPAGLVEAVTKALAPNRDDRYESMKTFGQALLLHASPRAGLCWADSFDLDERGRASLTGANGGSRSSLRLRAAAPMRNVSQVTITPTEDASSATDATVRLSVDELVAKGGTLPNTDTRALAEISSVRSPEEEPPSGPEPNESIESARTTIAREEKKVPWIWILVGVAILVALLVRALL